jgi:hypothetical protein
MPHEHDPRVLALDRLFENHAAGPCAAKIYMGTAGPRENVARWPRMNFAVAGARLTREESGEAPEAIGSHRDRNQSALLPSRIRAAAGVTTATHGGSEDQHGTKLAGHVSKCTPPAASPSEPRTCSGGITQL